MPSNQTPNYGLSQWSKSDRIQMEDFNADNAKIDAALKVHGGTLAAHAAQLAKLGNCQVWTTTYKGTGTVGPDHPTSLTFPKRPVFAMIDSGSGKPWSIMSPPCWRRISERRERPPAKAGGLSSSYSVIRPDSGPAQQPVNQVLTVTAISRFAAVILVTVTFTVTLAAVAAVSPSASVPWTTLQPEAVASPPVTAML